MSKALEPFLKIFTEESSRVARMHENQVVPVPKTFCGMGCRKKGWLCGRILT